MIDRIADLPDDLLSEIADDFVNDPKIMKALMAALKRLRKFVKDGGTIEEYAAIVFADEPEKLNDFLGRYRMQQPTITKH